MTIMPITTGFGPVELHRADGEISEHANMAEAIKATRVPEVTPAPEPHEDKPITAPAFLSACALFALWASGQMPHVPTASEARSFRHLSHVAAAAGFDEPSPIRIGETKTELRHRDAVRRWWA